MVSEVHHNGRGAWGRRHPHDVVIFVDVLLLLLLLLHTHTHTHTASHTHTHALYRYLMESAGVTDLRVASMTEPARGTNTYTYTHLQAHREKQRRHD